MVLNEPETSLHPELIDPLADMIAAAARQTQVVARPGSTARAHPAHRPGIGESVEAHDLLGRRARVNIRFT
jgi:hypothetical protein